MENSISSRVLRAERKKGQCGNQTVSPLAKYDSNGNLFCIICKSVLKSSSIWKVHINSKLHRQNVEEAKKIKHTILDKSVQNEGKHIDALLSLEKSNKNKSKETVSIPKEPPPKQNVSVPVSQEAADFLPEMFFDDPVVDAKIRHVEYTNTQNEEWARFQSEMKEESLSSNKIVFNEQANSAFDREINEISEQIYQWSKVIKLENKLENIVKREKPLNALDESDDNLSDDEVNDNLDWRSKKFI